MLEGSILTPRRDVVTSSAGQVRDETGRPGLFSVLDLRFAVPEGPCLHLDQGGDENSDDAFPLVVPTGFEPVSPP